MQSESIDSFANKDHGLFQQEFCRKDVQVDEFWRLMKH